MLKKLLSKNTALIVLSMLLILVAAALIIERISPQVETAVAAPAMPESYAWYTCTPAHVAVFTDRIHVQCIPAPIPSYPSVIYFAYSTSDSAGSSRILSVISTAIVANKTLYLYVDPTDLSGGSWGCGTGDCRVIGGAELIK